MTGEEFRRRIAQFSGRVIVDLGTGDGLFVYHCARKNPGHFYIGIDPNRRPLAGISEKIRRKILRGGAPNLIYVQAAAESLPDELQETANKVYILFPWGSLLGGVATGDLALLTGIHRISTRSASLDVLLTLDSVKDQGEIRRLGLPEEMNSEYIDVLARKYSAAGFAVADVSSRKISDLPEFQTTWARKLRAGARQVLWLHANRKD